MACAIISPVLSISIGVSSIAIGITIVDAAINTLISLDKCLFYNYTKIKVKYT